MKLYCKIYLELKCRSGMDKSFFNLLKVETHRGLHKDIFCKLRICTGCLVKGSF